MLCFLFTFCFLKEENFLIILAFFLQTLNANVVETAQNRDKLFYECILELNFAIINGLGEPIQQIWNCGGENVRSRNEEIRQSNCNAYISVYADLLCS